jgi:hypothetical protein
MKLSSLRLVALCGLVFLLASTISRADFTWEAQQGAPNQLTNFACDALPQCMPNGCTKVDPPVSVVPEGKTQSVVVRSYDKKNTKTYGTCVTISSGSCMQYPNVKCGEVWIYSQTGCNGEDLLGFASVYSGNCSP